MNATSPRSFPSVHSLPRGDDGTAGIQKSQSNVFPQSSGAGALPGRVEGGDRLAQVIEAERFRDWFAPAFARWLQENFRNPELVATLFGVRYQTALNWWSGANRASGDTVALVFLTYPQAVAWFLSEWEDRA